MLVGALLIAGGTRAADITLSIPTFEGNPDGIIRVPVEISDASGLASIRIQINFDPSLLKIEAAQPGALGAQFDFSSSTDGGTITLLLVRSTDLASGSGCLAELVFRANSGATSDFFSDLTIARFEVGNSTAVVDVTAERDIKTINGGVRVSYSPAIDNRPNGMPDNWEELHGINPLTSAGTDDPDQDGVPNIMEFAFHGNPHWQDGGTILPRSGVGDAESDQYMLLDFRRPVEHGALLYDLQESSDLIHWTTYPLSSLLIEPPVSRGDGSEDITVRANTPMRESTRQFLRIRLRW